jgi:hypothetical protein
MTSRGDIRVVSTEVYVQQDGIWKWGSLSLTRLVQ